MGVKKKARRKFGNANERALELEYSISILA